MQRIVYDGDSSMPLELQLIANPGAAFARVTRSPVRIGAAGALRRPAIVAVVLGASVAMAATREAPPALLLSTTLSWSVVVAAQVLIALALIQRPARATVGVARALDLFFAGHAPWSLWMLAVVAWAPVPGGRPLLPVLVAALVPLALTFRTIAAHFHYVLGFDRRTAVRRTIAHQALTWGLLLGTYGAAVALFPRVVQWIG
jgi:hypothetical protein